LNGHREFLVALCVHDGSNEQLVAQQLARFDLELDVHQTLELRAGLVHVCNKQKGDQDQDQDQDQTQAQAQSQAQGVR
jgi:hypothetical protein